MGFALRAWVGAAVLTCAASAAATSQIPEKIIVAGTRHALLNEPLHERLEKRKLSARVRALLSSGSGGTALWRGYIGTWEIRDDVLYLVAVHDGLNRLIPLDELLPADARRPSTAPDGAIQADWVSTQLEIGRGKWSRPPGSGWDGAYESYLLVDVRNGRVIGTREYPEPSRP